MSVIFLYCSQLFFEAESCVCIVESFIRYVFDHIFLSLKSSHILPLHYHLASYSPTLSLFPFLFSLSKTNNKTPGRPKNPKPTKQRTTTTKNLTSVSDLTRVAPLQNPDSSFLSRYQLQITCMLGVGLWAHFPSPCCHFL